MYISLYRKYRPHTFSDMVGQSAAVGVLMESLRGGTLGHAYLFSGPRGCGKTSAARIVAASLDCERKKDGCEPCGECESCRAVASGEHLDVIEIDGASNNGVDNIRDLKSQVSLKALTAAYKVYIIDEVHMLSTAAFNALLKTLEEPPANVVFLLATTEPHKVPVTIRSRCQHIPFHRITTEDAVKRLKYVFSNENIEADEEAVWEIARQADGALRDALSLSEQAVALGHGKVTLSAVRDLTGGSNRSELERWVKTLRTDEKEAALALHAVTTRGVSPERLCEAFFELFRDLWLYRLWGNGVTGVLETSAAEVDFLAEESPNWTAEQLEAASLLCSSLLPRTRLGMKGDIFAGLLFMRLRNILSGEAYEAPHTRKEARQTDAPQDAERGERRAKTPGFSQSGVSSEGFSSRERKDALPRVNRETRPAAREEAQKETGLVLPQEENFTRTAKEPLVKELKDNPMSRVIEALSGDWLPVAAALIEASIYGKDGDLSIQFDEECPAKAFMAAERNYKTAALAAAKLWGTKTTNAERESAEAKDRAAKEPAQEKKPVGAQNARREEDGAPALREHASKTEEILRRAGAELLYVRNDASGDEESAGAADEESQDG